MTIAESHPTRRSLRAGGVASQRRSDVQGLRTVAAVLVAAYHIWTYRISGAVDVFFVVSAFVMTQSMLRSFDRHDGVRFGRFLRDLLFRMAPLAWIVVGGTMIAALILMPITDWSTITTQAAYAGTFSMNYFLASESMAYLGDDANGSLFQHFWAMAVQVQFYLLFPLLGAVAYNVGRRLRRSPANVLLLIFIVMFVASFIYACVGVSWRQEFAYYDTPARAWEFAAGALAAIIIPRIRWGKWISAIASGLGLAALISFGALFNATTLSPGPASLVPVVAAVLILLGGVAGVDSGASRLLSWRPLVAAAEYSFGFYLWHWPVLVIYRSLTGSDRLDAMSGVGVMAAAAGLAFVTQRWLERPVRDGARAAAKAGGWKQPLFALAALALVPLLTVGGTRVYLDGVLAATPTTNPGAAVVADPAVVLSPLAGVQPSLATLADGQWESWFEDCEELFTDGGALYERCEAGSEDAPLSIVAVGDSHTEIWLTAFAPAIEDGLIRMTSLSRGGCMLSSRGDDKYAEDPAHVADCEQLNEVRAEMILSESPDVVFTTASIAQAGSPELTVPSGFVDAATQLTELGIPVVGFRDVPRHLESPGDCLESTSMNEEACAIAAEELLEALDFETSIPELLIANPLVTTVDMTDLLCFDGWCPAVIGGVIPYLDDNHLARDYVATMSPYVLERFAAALDRIPTPVSLAL